MLHLLHPKKKKKKWGIPEICGKYAFSRRNDRGLLLLMKASGLLRAASPGRTRRCRVLLCWRMKHLRKWQRFLASEDEKLQPATESCGVGGGVVILKQDKRKKMQRGNGCGRSPGSHRFKTLPHSDLLRKFRAGNSCSFSMIFARSPPESRHRSQPQWRLETPSYLEMGI
ncbi:unnamed protein product [Notodromas monacha]|uniref:Uncharacterized protein n=1 Tax=Notodromas monacha TaxID=399045 RepID=A0A7R9BFU3_9CRUS|nr:unnamed protein product [Notodromas monacha]CAG0913334.1 unnamed protein product [Notodromas monacha]